MKSNNLLKTQQQIPRFALLPLSVPGDWRRAAVLLAVGPRHALLADPAALAVGVDAAAEDVTELTVLAVPTEVPTVVAFARHTVARNHGYLVAAQLEVAVVGTDVGGEDEEKEDREHGEYEVGAGGHCDKCL